MSKTTETMEDVKKDVGEGRGKDVGKERSDVGEEGGGGGTTTKRRDVKKGRPFGKDYTFKKTVRLKNPLTNEVKEQFVYADTKEELELKCAAVRMRLNFERGIMMEEHRKKQYETFFPEKHFALDLPENGGVSIGLLGASRSGKTSVLKYLYKKYFSNRIGVMTTLSGHNEIYNNMSKRLIVDEEFHPNILRQMYLINHGTDNKYRFLFICDDYNGGVSKTNPEITRAMTIYRNSYIDFIYANQDPTLINSTGRGNLNYVCLFKFNTPQVIEKAVKMFLLSYFPTDLKMAEKIQLYDRLTRDHQFFFLDNIQGKIYHCKLTPEQLNGTEDESSSDEE